MKHARRDYNRIQDPENRIPKDEPVFLIRAKDKAAPETVEVWAMISRLLGADQGIVQLAIDQANAIRRWQKRHGCKVADL